MFFNTLKKNGIATMAVKISDRLVALRVFGDDFDDAIAILENEATESNCIDLLGLDESENYWVDRGVGQEINIEPRIETNEIHKIPKEYFELLSTIAGEFALFGSKRESLNPHSRDWI